MNLNLLSGHLPVFRLLTLIFALSATNILAQPAIVWEKTFGANYSDILTSVRPTSDGGFIAGGRSAGVVSGDKTQPSRGENDYWIVKVSANGSKQWDKTFGGALDDQLVQTFQTSDGGYMLAGYSKSDAGAEKSTNDKVVGNGRRGDFWIVRIDANGNKLWDKTIGGPSEDVLEDAKQTPDGGYILAGSSLSGLGGDKTQPSAGSRDFWLVRINAGGVIQWTQSIGSSNADRLAKIDNTPDGGFILGGGVRPLTSNDATAFVARLSAAGTVLWTKNLALPQTEINDIIATSDGGYLAAVQEQITGDAPYVLVKLNSTGSIVWKKSYVGGPTTNPSPSATLYAARATPDGGFLIGGGSNELAGNDKSEDRRGRGATDYWIIKIDANGARQWDKTIGGLSAETLFHLEVTADGGFILGGVTYSDPGADKSEASRGIADYWLVKLETPTADKRLDFTPSTLDFTVVKGGSTPPRSVFLNAFSGTPSVTLTKSPASSWLVLPPAAAGNLSFEINTAGLQAGNYQSAVIATAPGYTGDTLQISLVVTSPGSPVTIRIDAGGPGFTTSDGRVFGPDRYFGGVDRVYQIPEGNEIRFTAEDALYRTERSATSFQYNIPVTNDHYVVVLHFAEIWFGVSRPGGGGKRLFNVDLEGSRKLTQYDIYAKGSGSLVAIEEAFPVSITDGILNLNFTSGSANLPTVAAIEIIPEAEYIRTSLALPAIADAYVHTDSPAENFGTAPELIVKSGESNVTRNSYLKFRLNGFENIISARLRIYGVNVESTMQVSTSVFSVDNDSWTETGITYNNAPQNSFMELSHTTTNDDPGYRELDVTEFVQSQLASDKVVSLVVKNSTFVNKKLVFHSKENASGHAPQLLVTTTRPVVNGARQSAEAVLSAPASREKDQGTIVFPNPVRKQLSFRLSGRHEGNISLQLTEQSGRSFSIHKPALYSGKVAIDLSGYALKPGIYLLKIQSATATETIKVAVAE